MRSIGILKLRGEPLQFRGLARSRQSCKEFARRRIGQLDAMHQFGDGFRAAGVRFRPVHVHATRVAWTNGFVRVAKVEVRFSELEVGVPSHRRAPYHEELTCVNFRSRISDKC